MKKNLNFKKISKPLLIAEIGNNHEGSFDRAKKLIDAAKEAGADAVKFQTIFVDKFFHPNEVEKIKKYKKFELTKNQFKKLSVYTKKKKMLFLSTPFDLDSANFLRKIVDVIKIASGDNTFLPLIDRCISFKKPIIISTGLLKDNEIIKLYNYLKKKVDLKKVCLMHCVSSYPVENKDANIGYISHLKKKFKKITIGYSDHTIGPEASILAATLGSKVIEKHFTINKNYSSFRDHQLSADISELKLISKFIKKIKILLGKGKKNNLSKSEIKNLKLLRRSIYAAKNIKKKEVFSEKNIIHLRPFKKNNISKYKSILNRKSKKTFRKGELI